MYQYTNGQNRGRYAVPVHKSAVARRRGGPLPRGFGPSLGRTGRVPTAGRACANSFVFVARVAPRKIYCPSVLASLILAYGANGKPSLSWGEPMSVTQHADLDEEKT